MTVINSKSSSQKPSCSSNLVDTVIKGGYCIGCGVCAVGPGASMEINLDANGRFEASPNMRTGVETNSEKVCPFSDAAVDENVIAAEHYEANCAYDNRVGYHMAGFAGYVVEEPFRQIGSSGGMGKWIAYELLRLKLVDAVVHVEQRLPDDDSRLLYRYEIVTSLERLLQGSKSVYYPVEMSKVLERIRAVEGRYAIVGVPCFIKAVRLLCRHDDIYRERIAFCIGLICGHLKGTHYADMLGWQLGARPGELESIDFRAKLPGARANEKGVVVAWRENGVMNLKSTVVQNLFGTNYGYGFFKYKACDYCDDVFAETADVVVGDAWLPEYISDGQGTNVILVRDRRILNIIKDAVESGRVHLDMLSIEHVAASQDAGLRHRREGLAYRLYLADRLGLWRPRKRVGAKNGHISRRQAQIFEKRMDMAQCSDILFEEALGRSDFEFFRERMTEVIAEYTQLYRRSLARRSASKVLRVGRFLLRALWSRTRR